MMDDGTLMFVIAFIVTPILIWLVTTIYGQIRQDSIDYWQNSNDSNLYCIWYTLAWYCTCVTIWNVKSCSLYEFRN